MPAAEVAPDDVDAAARRIGSRVRIAVHPGAHARHAIEEVDHVEGRAPQRVIGNLCDRDRCREGGAAILRDRNHLQRRKFGRVCVFRPEHFHGSICGDRHLPGLTEALCGIAVGGADLNRRRPAHALVVRVHHNELDVAVASALPTENRHKDIDPAEVRAAGGFVDGEPLMIVEV